MNAYVQNSWSILKFFFVIFEDLVKGAHKYWDKSIFESLLYK